MNTQKTEFYTPSMRKWLFVFYAAVAICLFTAALSVNTHILGGILAFGGVGISLRAYTQLAALDRP